MINEFLHKSESLFPDQAAPAARESAEGASRRNSVISPYCWQAMPNTMADNCCLECVQKGASTIEKRHVLCPLVFLALRERGLPEFGTYRTTYR